MTLSIDFVNCFGIHSLKYDFEFKNGQNTLLLYAPNGTMKTSFAKTMSVIAKNDPKQKVVDQIHPDRTVTDTVLVDGNPIEPQDIFVVDAENEDYDATSFCSTFLASKELKKKYDVIYEELDVAQQQYIKNLKSASQSTDCQTEIIKTFHKTENDSFLDCLLLLENEIHDGYQVYDFKYNDVFDKNGKVKSFLDKHQTQLDAYLERYSTLLTTSILFHKNENFKFGTFQAEELNKAVKDGAFFGVNHKIVLSDGTEINDPSAFAAKIESEKQALLADEKLRKSFDSITKALDANMDLRLLKQVIESKPSLIVELADYEGLRRKFWMGHICKVELQRETLNLISLYKKKIGELQNIIFEAKKENDIWKKIVILYNSRFYVPFEVGISNLEDVILKDDVPNLQFNYIAEGNKFLQSKETLIKNILSKGERRALYILQMLFEIEGRRKRIHEQLLVFDDIADSFDYQNKYAIIEYLKDIQNDSTGHFKSILLTHNFDFYRTVSSRLGITENAFYASRDGNGNISLSKGLYRYQNPFELIQKNTDDNKCYVCMIPFVRNLVECHMGKKSIEYNTLTSCLHMKSNTKSLCDSEISKILRNYAGGHTWARVDVNTPIYNVIMNTATDIVSTPPPVDAMRISAKVVLAIAIRLLAEEYMIHKLKKSGVQQNEIDAINKDQERILLQKCRESSIDLDYSILESVNVMTPENIHLNSFMYEPLVDMPVEALIRLYNNCKKIRDDETL